VTHGIGSVTDTCALYSSNDDLFSDLATLRLTIPAVAEFMFLGEIVYI